MCILAGPPGRVATGIMAQGLKGRNSQSSDPNAPFVIGDRMAHDYINCLSLFHPCPDPSVPAISAKHSNANFDTADSKSLVAGAPAGDHPPTGNRNWKFNGSRDNMVDAQPARVVPQLVLAHVCDAFERGLRQPVKLLCGETQSPGDAPD